MTEKRFTFADGFKIVAIKDNGQIMNSRQVCELLNELYEENQHFEYNNKRMVKFIMSKGYGLKDYLDFCKEYEE